MVVFIIVVNQGYYIKDKDDEVFMKFSVGELEDKNTTFARYS